MSTELNNYLSDIEREDLFTIEQEIEERHASIGNARDELQKVEISLLVSLRDLSDLMKTAQRRKDAAERAVKTLNAQIC